MSRDNNFNLMRIVAAFAVLVSHSFTIVTGDVQSEPLKSYINVSLGTIAVDVFFACSGFLVCASYSNRSSLVTFTRARVLRIFPALFVMLFLTICGIGLFISSEPPLNYFINLQTFSYWCKNLMLFSGAEYSLPGAFLDNPYSGVVNGSLWTLPHEVRAYLGLALICWFSHRFLSLRRTRQLFVALCLCVLCVDALSKWFGIRIPHFHFVHLWGVFLVGAVFFFYKAHVSRWLLPITYLCCLAVAIIVYLDIFQYFYGFLLPIIAIGLAYLPVRSIRFYNRFGDYSYGVYIYAFPIQQTLVFYNPNITIYQMIVSASVISIMAAAFSWHLVEQRFLERE